MRMKMIRPSLFLLNRVKKIKFGVGTTWLEYKWIEFLLDLVWIIAFWEKVIGTLYSFSIISLARVLMMRERRKK
jgi:hypothetical protein